MKNMLNYSKIFKMITIDELNYIRSCKIDTSKCNFLELDSVYDNISDAIDIIRAKYYYNENKISKVETKVYKSFLEYVYKIATNDDAKITNMFQIASNKLNILLEYRKLDKTGKCNYDEEELAELIIDFKIENIEIQNYRTFISSFSSDIIIFLKLIRTINEILNDVEILIKKNSELN